MMPVPGLDFKRLGNFPFPSGTRPPCKKAIYEASLCCEEAQAGDVERPQRGQPRCLTSEESFPGASSLV